MQSCRKCCVPAQFILVLCCSSMLRKAWEKVTNSDCYLHLALLYLSVFPFQWCLGLDVDLILDQLLGL